MKKMIAIVASITIGILLLLVACSSNKEETVIVSFDVNGGSPKVDSQEIKMGTFATDPNLDLVKDGYIFNCWQLEGSEFIFLENEVNEDITLVACYDEVKKVSLTHNYDFTKLDETEGYVKEKTVFDINNEITSKVDEFNKLHAIVTTNKKLELTGVVLALRTFSEHKPAYLGTNDIIENLNAVELSYNVWGQEDKQVLELVKGIYLQTSIDGNSWDTIKDLKEDILNEDEFRSTVKVDVNEQSCYFRIYVDSTKIPSAKTFRILVSNIKFYTR